MSKKLYSLAAAAAILGLASCSSDEPANNGNNGGLAKGENYMAFTISNVGGNSRAIETGSENAEGKEGALEADDVRFYFYDTNGNAFNFAATENVNPGYTQNMVKPSQIDKTDNSTGADAVTGVLVLGKAADEAYVGATPSYVLCVANATANEYTALAGKSLTQALEATTNWAALTSESKFMMTSATWVNNNTVTVADDNIQSHVAGTPEAAQKNPININLERLAVKVRASYDAAIDVQAKVEGTTPDYKFIVNGEEATFSLAINGWQLQNTAVQANSFKKLNATYTWATDWKWNDATNKRSFWAETAPGTLANTSYDLYATGVNDQFTLKSFSTAAPTANIAYCYENTTDAGNTAFKVFDRLNTKATAIVVKGTLSMKVGETTTADVNLCKWFGNYYTEDVLVGMIKDAYNKENNTNLTEVQFVDNTDKEDNSWKAQINKGTADEPEWVDVNNFGSILRWQKGVTSYYLNIEHQTGLPGVVRNHIYDYTFDGIVGLGFPGNEKENYEDQETFVAAHLNVLNWNTVKNNITLQ